VRIPSHSDPLLEAVIASREGGIRSDRNLLIRVPTHYVGVCTFAKRAFVGQAYETGGLSCGHRYEPLWRKASFVDAEAPEERAYLLDTTHAIREIPVTRATETQAVGNVERRVVGADDLDLAAGKAFPQAVEMFLRAERRRANVLRRLLIFLGRSNHSSG
jgi:hypothetical protein